MHFNLPLNQSHPHLLQYAPIPFRYHHHHHLHPHLHHLLRLRRHCSNYVLPLLPLHLLHLSIHYYFDDFLPQY